MSDNESSNTGIYIAIGCVGLFLLSGLCSVGLVIVLPFVGGLVGYVSM